MRSCLMNVLEMKYVDLYIVLLIHSQKIKRKLIDNFHESFIVTMKLPGIALANCTGRCRVLLNYSYYLFLSMMSYNDKLRLKHLRQEF